MGCMSGSQRPWANRCYCAGVASLATAIAAAAAVAVVVTEVVDASEFYVQRIDEPRVAWIANQIAAATQGEGPAIPIAVASQGEGPAIPLSIADQIAAATQGEGPAVPVVAATQDGGPAIPVTVLHVPHAIGCRVAMCNMPGFRVAGMCLLCWEVWHVLCIEYAVLCACHSARANLWCGPACAPVAAGAADAALAMLCLCKILLNRAVA
eukprot:1136203-Pelagomonas_calceolata.AAC.7